MSHERATWSARDCMKMSPYYQKSFCNIKQLKMFAQKYRITYFCLVCLLHYSVLARETYHRMHPTCIMWTPPAPFSGIRWLCREDLPIVCSTPSCKSGLDFRLVLGMPLCQGGCMGPIWPETEVGQIISAHPPEIGAPVTPGVSHGTKIFGSKIFSYHPQMMLFYVFWGFVLQKMQKIKENCLFLHDFFVIGKSAKNRQFFSILSIFCKTNPQNT